MWREAKDLLQGSPLGYVEWRREDTDRQLHLSQEDSYHPQPPALLVQAGAVPRLLSP